MKIEKLKKLVINLHDKTEYIIHIRNLKALNHGLILKKVLKKINFNQKIWPKPYIDMNTKLRQKTKNYFEQDLFKLMNNAAFGKIMENMRKPRDYLEEKLFSIRTKLSYYKVFQRKCISYRNEENSKILMNNPVYLGLSRLYPSKTVMYEFWYDSVKLCYMDTECFIIHVIASSTKALQKILKQDLTFQIVH